MNSKDNLILYVEDSEDDYRLVSQAFRRAKLNNPLFHCEDGEDALDYLFHQGKYQDCSHYPRPTLILLDLNLPGTDGKEVLEEIKKNEDLKNIPVVVLTTSSDPNDIRYSYSHGANSYLQKPVRLDDFFKTIQSLKEYWLETNLLPC